ncbi:MAG: hypothetical protein IBJ10_09555, partial [Phycisphaerales bacterium]|nr:hypothetical protein [Phycisphaerales bacterium]
MFDLSARRHAATSGLRSAQLLIAAGLAASVGGAASGALIVSTWAAAASGTWNTASNWSPNANFPNNGTPVGDTYHAIIDATGPNYTVTLNTNVTLDMLTLNSANATLSHSGGSFNPGVANISAGTYRLVGGSITGGVWNISGTGVFDVASSGNNNIIGATINGDIILSANSARSRVSGATRFGTARLSGPSSSLGFAPGYTLLDAIRAEGAGGGSRNVEMNGSAGTVTIGATGSITHAAGTGGGFNIGGSQWFGGAMTLVNDGLIQMDASGQAMSIAANSFTNNGTLRVTAGTTTISSWSNAGLVEVSGGTLNLGAFNTTSGIGTWNRTGGAVNINGAINNAGSSFTLNNSTGSWTLLGGSITGGEVNLADAAQLLVGANSANTLSGVDLNGDLILSAGSARARVIGATRFDTARLSGASSSLAFAPGYTLMDAVVAQGAGGGSRNVEMNGAAGTFTIGATGSITHAAGAGGGLNIGGSQWFGGAMTLVNNGLIQMDASGQAMSIEANSFTNNGTLRVTTGTTTVSSWSNAGLVEVSGGTLNLGAFNVTSGIGTGNRTGGPVSITGPTTKPA